MLAHMHTVFHPLRAVCHLLLLCTTGGKLLKCSRCRGRVSLFLDFGDKYIVDGTQPPFHLSI